MSNFMRPRYGARIGVAVALVGSSIAGTSLAGQPFFTTNQTLPTGEVLGGAVPPSTGFDQLTADFAASGSAAANVYVAAQPDHYEIGVRLSSDGSIVRLLAPATVLVFQNSEVESANALGQAVGYFQYATNAGGAPIYAPVRWDRQGNPTPLGVLHAPTVTGAFDVATDISNTGIATGISRSGSVTVAVRWDANSATPTALPGVFPNATGDIYAVGFGVNDAGTVVGRSSSALGNLATRWAAGGTTGVTLDTVNTGTSTQTFSYRATDINNAGTTIGDAQGDSTFDYTGVRWDANSTAATILQSIGTDANGRSISRPLDINNAGTVVGRASVFDSSHVAIASVATKWNAGSGVGIALAHLPGRTNSNATAINDAGFIVGSDSGTGFPGRAVAWLPDGSVIDLNSLIDPGSGYVLTNAWSISEDNWISGSSTYDPDGPGGVDGIPHNFLIQLPEPASLTSMGLVAVMLRRRGR